MQPTLNYPINGWQGEQELGNTNLNWQEMLELNEVDCIMMKPINGI